VATFAGWMLDGMENDGLQRCLPSLAIQGKSALRFLSLSCPRSLEATRLHGYEYSWGKQ
jgi:hypothetical protein